MKRKSSLHYCNYDPRPWVILTEEEKRGNYEKACIFKRAIADAVGHIKQWLDSEAVGHIKNYFPVDSLYGCESYAYFDKYMVTTASRLYFAYAMCDDSINESVTSDTKSKYVWSTSEHFHMTFVKFNDLFLQFDTNANTHYDAAGLGRIHKKGIPSQLCLSVPFCQHPGYTLDIENPSGL